jgi:IS5 family transposase
MIKQLRVLLNKSNISDAQAEYQIKGRLSFMRFLGPALSGRMPDGKTVWEYREHLVEVKITDTLFYGFIRQLEEKKVISYNGSIADAAFADAPRQRNSREENKTIKEGGVPEEWEQEANRNKRRQKDTDVRRAKKNNEAHTGTRIMSRQTRKAN